MERDENRIREELRQGTAVHPLLSLGVTRTIGEYAALSPLLTYLRAHPDMNLHLHYGNTEELLSLLDAGTISLALIEGNVPKGKYGVKKYRTEDFCAVCSAAHTFAHGTPRQVRDLLSERLLLREPGSGTRSILEKSLSALGLAVSDFPSYLEVENMHILIRLLEQDMGISFPVPDRGKRRPFLRCAPGDPALGLCAAARLLLCLGRRQHLCSAGGGSCRNAHPSGDGNEHFSHRILISLSPVPGSVCSLTGTKP